MMKILKYPLGLILTLVWLIYAAISIICFLPSLFKARKMKEAGDVGYRKIMDKCVHMWMSSLLWLAGTRVHVEGLQNIPKDRSVVFVCNHQGDFDVPVTMVNLGAPPAMVSKIEVNKVPLVRDWMYLLDCIFIDRKDPRQAISAMRGGKDILESGRNIVVFPEGTRSKGDHMNEFKHGVFKIPCSAGAPIVPVIIDGTYKVFEANHNLIVPAKVNLTVLPPIETKDMDRLTQKALPETVHDLMAKAKGLM